LDEIVITHNFFWLIFESKENFNAKTISIYFLAVGMSVVGILCQTVSLSYMSGKMFVVVGCREGIGRALFEKENDISRV
jgi:hypothetical protein